MRLRDKGPLAGAAAMAMLLAIWPRPAVAQGILPNATPDVVFACYSNDAPSSACALHCAIDFGYESPVPQPPNPPSKRVGGLHVTNVSRIEIFSNGKAGRADTRSWVAYRYKVHQTEAEGLFYTGPNVFCSFNMKQISPPAELRVEKFDQ